MSKDSYRAQIADTFKMLRAIAGMKNDNGVRMDEFWVGYQEDIDQLEEAVNGNHGPNVTRNDVIEECAQIVDERIRTGYSIHRKALAECASKIRALNVTPATNGGSS